MVGDVKYGLEIGNIYKSNRCGDFTVKSFKDAYNIEIDFVETGTKEFVAAGAIRTGSVGDRNHPTIFGVGCIGYGKYKSREGTSSKKNPPYSHWENMLARCYYPKTARYSAYGGKGVYVCKEWLNFQVFATWFDENYREGYHLDSDILTKGSEKFYSPHNSVFVPQELNGLFVNNYKNRLKVSGLPEGVSATKSKNRPYQSAVSLGGRPKNNKTFSDLEDACDYYTKEKTRVVKEFVEDYYLKGLICERVYEALKDYKFIRGE